MIIIIIIIIIIIKSNIILDSVLYHYDELCRGCYSAGHGNCSIYTCGGLTRKIQANKVWHKQYYKNKMLVFTVGKLPFTFTCTFYVFFLTAYLKEIVRCWSNSQSLHILDSSKNWRIKKETFYNLELKSWSLLYTLSQQLHCVFSFSLLLYDHFAPPNPSKAKCLPDRTSFHNIVSINHDK